MDILTFKHDLLDYLLGEHMGKFSWGEKADIPGLLRDICKTVGDFRDKNGWSFVDCHTMESLNLPRPKLGWRAGFPKSAESLLLFIDRYVYGIQEDAHIRAAVRSRKDVPNFLDTEPMKTDREHAGGQQGRE